MKRARRGIPAWTGLDRPSSRGALLLGLLMLAVAGDIQPESLVLQSYYPSPLGIYSSLVTTDATLLARDHGNVGVGTTAAPEKLSIMGNVYATGNLGSAQWGPGPSAAGWDGGVNTEDGEFHGALWSNWLASGGPDPAHASDQPNFLVEPTGKVYAEDVFLRQTGQWVSAMIGGAGLQRRVAAGCPVGQAIRAINADGTVVCQTVGAGPITYNCACSYPPPSICATKPNNPTDLTGQDCSSFCPRLDWAFHPPIAWSCRQN